MSTLGHFAVNVNWHYAIQNLVIVLKITIINNFKHLLVLYNIQTDISKVYLFHFC